MDNEAVLKQILNKLGDLETKLTGLETRFDGMEIKLSGLETRLKAVFEQTALLTEFKTETEAALTKINKTIESKYDLILRDIELVAGEQGKQRIDKKRGDGSAFHPDVTASSFAQRDSTET